MANRYWVGGTATWDGTAGTKWSTTSGGAGGSAVPTAADDVFFDGSSGSGTITLSSSSVCRSINCTGFTGTISHPASTTLTIGDASAGASNIALKFVSGMTYTLGNAATSAISFISTSATVQTIDWGSKTTGNITFNGVGGSWQYLSAHTANGTSAVVTLTNGDLDINGQTCSWNQFNSNNSNTRSLTLGSANITCSGNSTGSWNIGTSTGMTFSGASSTITMASPNTSFSGGGLTYGTVALVFGSGGPITINQSNSFTNLTLNPTSNNTRIELSADQTVSGVLTVSGSAATSPNLIKSTVIGTARTITVNGSFSISNISFMDITAAGSAGTWSGTTVGDAGGNSNITFTAPVTRYWVATTGGSTNATSSWSTSSGGSSGASVPLPQDTIVFDQNSITSGGRTITVSLMCCPSLDFSLLANSPTISFTLTNGQIFVIGDLTLQQFVTVTASTQPFLSGRGSRSITSNSGSFSSGNLDVRTSGTYTLNDNLTLSNTSTLTITQGTFDANDKDISCGLFNSSNSNTRTIRMGSGTWNLTGSGTIWNLNITSNLTLVVGTSTVKITNASASSKTLLMGGGGGVHAFNNVWITGSGTGTYTFGSAGFGTIDFNDFKVDSGPKNIVFIAGAPITVQSFTVNGVAGGLIAFTSSTPGTAWSLVKSSGSVICNLVSFTDCTATGGATFTATHSVDGGNNTGWTFTLARPPISSRSAISGRTAKSGRMEMMGTLVKNGNVDSLPVSNVAATNVNERWITGSASGSTTDNSLGWKLTSTSLFAGGTGFSGGFTVIGGANCLQLISVGKIWKSGGTISQLLISNTSYTASTLTEVDRPNLIPVLPSTSYTFTGLYWVNQLDAGVQPSITAVEYDSGLNRLVGQTRNTLTDVSTEWRLATLTFTTSSTTQYVAISGRVIASGSDFDTGNCNVAFRRFFFQKTTLAFPRSVA